jgi:hypothetical protein
VTIDFITDLPLSRLEKKIYDSILVIVDKLIKITYYISTRKNIKAKDLAHIFLREVIRLYDILRSIMSDRGLIMILKY